MRVTATAERATLRAVPAEGVVARQPTPIRWAVAMSWGIAVLMAGASLMGLLAHGLYAETTWAREALRGGDLVTLTVVVPLLIAALLFVHRGSRRAEALWMGILAYAAYDYAYYVFGATFNDAFILHIALLSLSVFALICALPNLDRHAIANRLWSDRPARWAGWFLAIVGVVQGLLWVVVIVRNAITGAVIEHIPVAGQHLVFALDLSLLVPSLVASGVLLARRAPIGFLAGTAMAVMGAAYQLNLMVGGAFQARANVPGVTAFPPEGLVLTAGFIVAGVVLLRGQPVRR